MAKKIGVVIGRFQIFHAGHAYLVQHALKNSDHVIIVLGSANAPVSIKNPFNYTERADMIHAFLKGLDPQFRKNKPVSIVSAQDNIDDKAWERDILNTISGYCTLGADEVTLYGHTKDESSFYLNDLFKGLNKKELDKALNISACELRDEWLNNNQDCIQAWTNQSINRYPKFYRCVSSDVINVLNTFAFKKELQDEYDRQKLESDYHKKEAAKYANYPYPETLNLCCADAVVFSQNHVVVIERKNAPGKGNIAVPGGFKNSNETFLQTAIRELREETGLVVDERDMVGSKLFDDPNRSTGITRITQAFYFQLDDCKPLNPSDDAAKAIWARLDILADKEIKFHDDHAKIISAGLNFCS